MFPFFQCILDYFGCKEDVLHVSCHLKDDRLILSDAGENKILIKVGRIINSDNLKPCSYTGMTSGFTIIGTIR